MNPPILTGKKHNELSLRWEPSNDNFCFIDNYELTMKYIISNIANCNNIKNQFYCVYVGKELFYTVPNLLEGSSYEFKIRCHNEHGWNDWSESVQFTTLGKMNKDAQHPEIIDNTQILKQKQKMENKKWRQHLTEEKKKKNITKITKTRTTSQT